MFTHADYVYAVYQERSFTKAAKKLYISQPSLSATVTKLEQRLGFAIFQRGGNQLQLTCMGEKYIAAAEKILSIQRQFETEIDDLLHLYKGSITLGSTTFIASYMLPGLLRKFSTLYPDIEIKLYVEQSTVLREMVEKGIVDLAIDNTLSCDPEYEYTLLFNERILVGVPEHYPINERLQELQLPKKQLEAGSCDYKSLPKTDIALFQDEPFILLKSGNKMRQLAGLIFEQQNVNPNVCYEFDQLMTSISFAQNGFGLCFLTDTILKYAQPCDGLVFYQPNTTYSDRPLYVICKKSKYQSTAAQALHDFLQQVFA